MEKDFFQSNIVNSDRILYTPSAFAKQSLIHLQEVGTLKANKPHINKRSRLASYLFFIVIEGEGSLEYEGEKYHLNENDCVFIDCRNNYCHQSSEKLWKLKWAHFNGENMNGIYEKFTERCGSPVFKTKNPAKYETALDVIYETANSSDYVRDMKIFEKLTSLLSLIMEDCWTAEKEGYNSPKKQNLFEIKEYIDTNISEKITLDELSEKFFVNKFYLTRIFKDQFGISVNNYIIQQRITYAKRLLRFSDMTIEEIAATCGISDGNYFAKVFKKVEGVSPREFRRRW